jgi:hypothetical protein
MTRPEIKTRLLENHQRFTDLILSLNDSEFLLAANDKWTAGQQLDHIYLSVSPVRFAFSMPKLMLKLFFGKANRPSRDYAALVARYQQKLAGGYKASERFLPKPVAIDQKTKLKDKLMKAVNNLCKNIDSYNEKQLDEYILPHPLLGKLTLREMLYFTIYHAEHHQQLTMRNLGR